MVPPVRIAEPLESSPSAPAVTSTSPPLIVIRTPSCAFSPVALRSVALRPSSLAVTSTVPPAMVIAAASRPSSDSVTPRLPSATLIAPVASTPSSPAASVTVPVSIWTQPGSPASSLSDFSPSPPDSTLTVPPWTTR